MAGHSSSAAILTPGGAVKEQWLAWLHVIAHCLGSVSFMMSLFGGAVTRITSVVANSAALTPRVPRWSRVKLTFAPFLLEYLMAQPYLNPRWSEDPGLTLGKLFSKTVSLFHRECDVPACHMLSLMWGTGWPALYSHDKLHPVTHQRGGDLYGGTGVHYYRHVRKMVSAGRAVKMKPEDRSYAALPDDYFQHAAKVATPVLLTTGDRNRVFANSNVVCHQMLERVAPGKAQAARVSRVRPPGRLHGEGLRSRRVPGHGPVPPGA